MHHAETRTERRKRETHDALLDAADHAFASRGFGSVTVEAIADAADVAVGTLYNRFGSKDGLYLAVIERALDFDERFMGTARNPEHSAVEQLEDAGRAYLRFYLERPDHFRLVAFPQAGGGGAIADEIAERLAERVARLNAAVADLVREGVAAGDLRSVDPVLATTYLWASWNGVVSLAWRHDALGVDQEGLEALIGTGIDLLRHGMLAPTSSGIGLDRANAQDRRPASPDPRPTTE